MLEMQTYEAQKHVLLLVSTQLSSTHHTDPGIIPNHIRHHVIVTVMMRMTVKIKLIPSSLLPPGEHTTLWTSTLAEDNRGAAKVGQNTTGSRKLDRPQGSTEDTEETVLLLF